MEDNKNTHPPPKTRRAQVANACMKCRDAKLKVSIHSFFFFSFFFTNINMKHKHKQYNTIQKEERKKQEINVAHVMKIFMCYTVLLHSSRLRSMSRSEARVRVRRDRRHDEATTRSRGFAGFGRTVASEEDVVAIFTESED